MLMLSIALQTCDEYFEINIRIHSSVCYAIKIRGLKSVLWFEIQRNKLKLTAFLALIDLAPTLCQFAARVATRRKNSRRDIFG